MVLALLLLFTLALFAPLLHRVARSATGWLLALVPAGSALALGALGSTLGSDERLLLAWEWSPELGVRLSFALDGLSLLFALLICGIGALVLVYAGQYLAGHSQLGRFYAFLLLFMGAMLGLVLADNLLTLFVFWELTSISSFLLIGFTHERTESRAAARQALLVTGGGGLALLVGLIMLGLAGGSFELSELLARGDALRAHPLYGAILALVLTGAFTKSAQFPFHFWLPSAMEAPTPVSAYLHSATMVKAGVYLLARLSPVLGGTPTWTALLVGFGATTMLVGGMLALYQTDLKRILAYTTVSALGTLVLLLGIGSEAAITAAVVFLLAHALYKGALFMLAGAIDHETGTRNVERLGGLRRAMPVTAAIAVLAAVSLSGLGPVLSFIAKELLFEAMIEEEQIGWALGVVAVLASALFVLEALIVTVRPFFGAEQATPKVPHEAPPSMWLGPALLSVAGLVVGLAPALVERTVTAASSAILGRPAAVDLYLWHGFNLALGMTGASALLGIAMYRAWAALRRTTPWAERALGFWPSDAYRLSLDGVNQLARAVTRALQSGYLRQYLFIILLATVGFVGLTLAAKHGAPVTLAWTELRFYEAVLAALMLAAAIYAVVAPGRLSAVAALGIVGYGIALIYILYGAPDLAMTQILVETLTVLLFVLAFHHLPRFQNLSTPLGRARDALIALGVGGLMTALVLAATATPPESRLADFFAENSKPVAHGSNIVNVILVDFRALDTFGEITVLSIAAFGVYALLKLGRRQRHARYDDRRLRPAGLRGALFLLGRWRSRKGTGA
jgi:multicomponent Na+:H+ antiporter subunit A